MDAPLHDRPCFRAKNQILTGPGSCTDRNVFFHEVGDRLVTGPGGTHQANRIFYHMRRDRHLEDHILQLHDFGMRKNRHGFLCCAGGGIGNDLFFLMGLRIINPDVEHEAVQLRFGKRIRSFLFDGVLGRQNKKRCVQCIGFVACGYSFFLHGFEQGGLGLGRCPIDFIGEEQIAEDGATNEAKLLFAGGDIGFEHVRADDVGRHQVGRKLNTLETKVEYGCDRANEQRLGHAGQPDQQGVSAREDAHQHFIEHVALTDNHLPHLVSDPVCPVTHGQCQGHLFSRCDRRNRRFRRILHKDETGVPQRYHIIMAETADTDHVVVYHGAVGAIQIPDFPLSVFGKYFRVPSGYRGVFHRQVVVVCASDPDGPVRQFKCMPP